VDVAGCDDVRMDEEDRQFYRWYGPWAPLTPAEVADLFAGVTARWWIVGGWAVDAFTGRSRDHEDIDIGFFRADLPAILEHLSPDLCVWSNASGTLRPLKQPDDLLEDCRQLWVRHDGGSPWLVDLAMTPHDGETWLSHRDETVRLPLDEAVFTGSDGIDYLRPEIVLSFKARRVQRSDDADFDAVVPLLDSSRRDWLRAAIERVDADHAWLDRLRSFESTK
jgi:hypothetical protein